MSCPKCGSSGADRNGASHAVAAESESKTAVRGNNNNTDSYSDAAKSENHNVTRGKGNRAESEAVPGDALPGDSANTKNRGTIQRLLGLGKRPENTTAETYTTKTAPPLAGGFIDANCGCGSASGTGSIPTTNTRITTNTILLDTPVGPSERHTIALVGNPNNGKSTLFNLVTGAHQQVINAPGTTVELMKGTWRSINAEVIDLPGTYSLIANSPDEQVVTDTLTGPESADLDLVLVVLDATAIERSLYLLAQVAQRNLPVACVVTMADVSAGHGENIDTAGLEKVLGVPVMALDPRGRVGLRELERMTLEALRHRPRVQGIGSIGSAGDIGFAAGDSGAGDSATNAALSPEAAELAQAGRLFDWVKSVLRETGKRTANLVCPSLSDKIDRWLLNPVIGLPVFFGLMWLLFQLAGTWIGPLQDLFDGLFASTEPGSFSLANCISWVLARAGLGGSWVESLLVGGLATGLGVVASFFPLMLVIFLAISLLEDSGYMARAAFLGDRLMRKIGLDGRVILPLIMGFGCNLPALAAVRTLPSARQRLVATLIIPYTSCAARLTIYLMIAKIFFPEHTGTIVWAMYLVSIVMVVAAAWVLRRWITHGEAAAPLMLVLPAYQVPRAIVSLKNTWLRSWAFVRGAGKIIVAMTMVVWLLGAIPVGAERGIGFADADLPMSDSLYGRVAQGLEPVFAPTGFGEWHLTGALMTGFVAKETVVSSIVTSFNMDEEAAGDAEENGDNLGELPGLLRGALRDSAGAGNEAAAALAFLVFVLTYTPCLATVAEQVRQIGGRRAAAAVGVQLAVAWVLAVAVFQVGALL
ncbi:MAG: ferrous iron transport protein B [Varibaculum sp.]|nr:ferrous iron transport protein B [Varibaculum sp.]